MESGAPLLDFLASAQARDAGIEQVTENNSDWMALALLQLEQLARMPNGWANTEHGVTGEDLRRMLIARVGHPGHANAWGALINKAVRDGLLKATGAYRAMKEKRSHARKTPVYVFMGN
jgi:hypothetical protein